MSYNVENLTDGNRHDFLRVIDALLDKHTFSDDGSVKLTTEKGDDVEAFQRYRPFLAHYTAIDPKDHATDWGDWFDATVHINKGKLLELRNLILGKPLGVISAELKIEYGVPIVTVQDKEYRLEPLHPGTPTDIINYAYEKGRLGARLTLDSLKVKLGGTSLTDPQANLKQIFKKNPFLVGDLSPFAEIGSKSVIFRREVKLTQDQLEKIQKSAKNSTS